MKGKNYIITYISALIIGILLLIYHDREQLYNNVVIAIGALIALPSLILLIIELFKSSKKSNDVESKSVKAEMAMANWSTIVAGIAGLALGIWMLCSPAFFIKAIIYTLGAILILVGLVQIAAIYSAARPIRPVMLWFIIPALTLIAGLVIILMGPEKVSAAAGLIAGISLVVYAANGFASAGREAKIEHDIAEGPMIASRREREEESPGNTEQHAS